MSTNGNEVGGGDGIIKQFRPCTLCSLNEDDPLNYGELKHCITKNGRDIYAHNFCLLFACKLEQNGEDHEGINGFLPEDIQKEKNRGGCLKCIYCNQKGATTACSNQSCKATYHFTCAINRGPSERPHFNFCDSFTSYCKKHEPIVKIRIGKTRASCTVCLSTIGLESYKNNSLIQCDCCDHLAHVSCIKKYAKSAGLTHFKCTNCNCSDLGDKEEVLKKTKKCKAAFVRKCQLQGVFIPDRDAEWEDGVTFADHYKDYDQCDAEVCLDPEGRKHDIWKKCEPWYICLCCTCGSSGIHRKCGGIKGEDVDSWYCKTCSAVYEKSAVTSSSQSQSILNNALLSSSQPNLPSHANESTRPCSSAPSSLNGQVKAIKRPRSGSASSGSKNQRKDSKV